jgi:NAD(P)-dependent dehydrogenase (short-subunit alcohol dehydrogenase family)
VRLRSEPEEVAVTEGAAPAGSSRRVVLTTGANSGIGLATTIELARRGFTSVGSVRSAAKAATVRDAAAEAGVEVDTVECDVTDPVGSAAAVGEVVARHGPIYGLVNNAGYALSGAVEDVTDEEARDVLETMVLAPARLARLVLPVMRERGGGRIVNLSSIYGRTTTPLTGWYQAAKHALEGLSDALRMEVAGANVQVVLIEPGGFRTDIWGDVEDRGDGPPGSRYRTAYGRARQSLRLSAPLMGDPASCARVIGRVLETRWPRARYLVGYDALLLAAASQMTPTTIKDRVTRLVMGL